MNATESPAGRYLAGFTQHMRDCLELAQIDDVADIPTDIADRLDLDRAHGWIVTEPHETACEIAEAGVYDIQRLATIERDGMTVGDLREVELLLGGGGPTITFTVRLRDGEVRSARLWHSWGADIGHEATVEVESQADLDTVAEYLRLLAVTED